VAIIGPAATKHPALLASHSCTVGYFGRLYKQQLLNIISPFDDLWGSEKIDW